MSDSGTYARWTKTARQCYKLGPSCRPTACPLDPGVECMMKQSIQILLNKLGEPGTVENNRRENIFKTIQDNPGISTIDIARLLNTSATVVKPFVDEFVLSGKLTKIKKGVKGGGCSITYYASEARACVSSQ